jgi:YD repeat-containing protein
VNNVVTVTAPNLNVTINNYDALNRVVKVTDSVGLVQTDAYDADNNRISRGDGDGNITNSTYDPLNRLVTVTDPLGKVTSIQYDAMNNRLSVTWIMHTISVPSVDRARLMPLPG